MGNTPISRDFKQWRRDAAADKGDTSVPALPTPLASGVKIPDEHDALHAFADQLRYEACLHNLSAAVRDGGGTLAQRTVLCSPMSSFKTDDLVKYVRARGWHVWTRTDEHRSISYLALTVRSRTPCEESLYREAQRVALRAARDSVVVPPDWSLG